MSDNFNIQAFVRKTRNADFKALQEGYDNVPGETATALMNTPNTVQAVEQVIRILKEMNVDPETMTHILDQLGMDGKMVYEMKGEVYEEDEEMQDITEAEEEEVEEETEDVFAMEEPDGEEAIEVEDTAEIETPAASTDSKEIFSKLVDAYEAAKALGDDKLTRQLANTITYFNKSVIFGDTK